VQIIESGSIIVNAEKFSSIIKSLPDGDIAIGVDSNLTMNIKNGKSQFTLHGIDSATFPLLPALKGEVTRDMKKFMPAPFLRAPDRYANP
jgi:DNA polymerase-3 subunit beta